MLCNRVKEYIRKVVTSVFFAGALPFLFYAPVHAEESKENKWLDDYSAHVGLTYNAELTLNSTYLWRGLCLGALNIQPTASIGYGGAYATMWWNIGTFDWSFARVQPEIDIIFGFARWGIDASVMYVHSFDRAFFDFSNHPDGGNGLEVRLRYTVSSKLPLSIFWATRVGASDGYLNDTGDTIRAYSSYAEISYTHHFPYDISLYGAVGITPWKSFYTGYKGNFAVQNIELRLRKDWSLHERCGLMLQGTLSINPSALAADKTTAQWHPLAMTNQSVNANLTVGVYLK